MITSGAASLYGKRRKADADDADDDAYIMLMMASGRYNLSYHQQFFWASKIRHLLLGLVEHARD
eukprot:5965749-Pleurochrysis_carterae.AAC.1